ncbi:hypothetical protein J4212_06865 [Candidatus Woesearchaeota archaeon]|nr:hypothetical protein [Candidatus Woesearchaeota archaeon]
MSFFLGFKHGMKEFGHCITIIINTALLFFVYIIGVGITSIFAKLMRKEFFPKKPDSGKKTYWEKLELGKEEEDYYYRQF